MKLWTIFFSPLLLLTWSLAYAANSGQLNKEFDSCIERSQGVNVAMLDCIVDETVRQDKLLNVVYKQLLGAVNAPRQNDLREAQRAWIKFRDANCDFYYDAEGGSSAQLIASDCRMTMTADRAVELRALYEMTR